MDTPLPRRDFLRAAPAALGALAATGRGLRAAPLSRESRGAAPPVLHPFDYRGVRLLDSPWQRQMRAGREYYFGLEDADILHGFRVRAGLSSSATDPVRGWGINETPGAILGQWLSGMARLSLATDDGALRDKAVRLMNGWGETLRAGGATETSHYSFDKYVGGLVDMYVYAGEAAALPLLERLVRASVDALERDRVPASASRFFGSPNEWYTLSENLYRAHAATGDPLYRDFAEVWLYHPYWEKFATTSSPADAHGVHAYSHVNTFSSAAAHYELTGDPRWLDVLRNAYDYLQAHQCFATGGFGPDERFLDPDGGLGRALETRTNTFETVCGSWAGFKLARYLTRFTGEARYGDWMERLFYNGVGAALPVTDHGRNFYYSDYRISGGMKVYRYDNYTCCSGSYCQCMADYHNLVYYRDDADGLYVNLYLPSEVTWTPAAAGGRAVTVRQETDYPLEDTTTLTVDAPAGTELGLRFRVPGWSDGMRIAVNGRLVAAEARPGTWATVRRAWGPGDRVEVTIPQRFRWQAVDEQHPDRAAIVRGAVVMPLEFRYFEPGFRPPRTDDALDAWLTRDEGDEVVKGLPSRGAWRVPGENGRPLAAKVRPFFHFTENYPYLMYMDREYWPTRLW